MGQTRAQIVLVRVSSVFNPWLLSSFILPAPAFCIGHFAFCLPPACFPLSASLLPPNPQSVTPNPVSIQMYTITFAGQLQARFVDIFWVGIGQVCAGA
jgi:hypothetical protein